MATKKNATKQATSTTVAETPVDKESTPVLDSQFPNPENKTEQTPETPVDTTPTAIDSEFFAIFAPPAPEKIECEAAKPTVYTASAKLYKHEKEYIDKILEARQSTVANGKPLTRDMNHFIRQCIRFTVNHRKNAAFWLPDNIAETLIDT